MPENDRAVFQMKTGRATLELTSNPSPDIPLALHLTGNSWSGTRETVTALFDEEKVRALYTGLDITAPRPLQLPEELYTSVMDAIGTAIEYSDVLDDEALEADDMEAQDKHHQQAADFRELRDRLKVLTGHAKNFDDHFTVVKDSNGDPVDMQWIPGTVLDDEALRYVWTVMDCDGELCIAPGAYYVNRMQYLRTVEPWTDADEKEEWIY